MTVTSDETGYEATRKLSFTLKRQQYSIGVVVVQLHHSARQVQVQGSAVKVSKVAV